MDVQDINAAEQLQLIKEAILEKIDTGRKDVEAERVIPNDQVLRELQDRIDATISSED
jgi:hypothetical protein